MVVNPGKNEMIELEGNQYLRLCIKPNVITDADNIVVVQDGHIEAQGTHEQLKENCPLYSKMWNSYLGVRDVA